MKKLATFALLFSLSSCQICDWDELCENGEKIICDWDLDRNLYSQLYKDCLSLLSEARKGNNYSTNDDEDYDQAIDMCQRSSRKVALLEQSICELERKQLIEENNK